MYDMSTRDDEYFNVYRNDQLVSENISDSYFIDSELETGDYCYEIYLLDDEGNEAFDSIEECIGFEQEITYISGDVTQDGLVNVLDVVLLVDWILTDTSLTDLEITIADMSGDGLVNVLDIVALVNVILNP